MNDPRPELGSFGSFHMDFAYTPGQVQPLQACHNLSAALSFSVLVLTAGDAPKPPKDPALARSSNPMLVEDEED